MRIVQVGGLPVTVLPQHHEVFAREIWGPATGGKKVTVLHNVMLAHGGADMHTHPDSEHIFYVLTGEMKVSDGKQTVILTAGHEDNEDKNQPESEGVLPAMDKDLAVELQEELLKRADVQKVIQTNR